jgi:hypothetical protein
MTGKPAVNLRGARVAAYAAAASFLALDAGVARGMAVGTRGRGDARNALTSKSESIQI